MNVLFQTSQDCFTVRRLKSQQLGKTGPVGMVFDDAQFDVGTKLLPELLVVLLSSDLFNHIQSLTHQLLTDYLEKFVLLEGFSGHIQGQVVRINHSPDEVKVFGHHVVKIICDEDSPDEQLDEVIFLGSVLIKHPSGSGSRNEQDGFECDLALRSEMDVGQRLVRFLRESLVESLVFILLHLFSWS